MNEAATNAIAMGMMMNQVQHQANPTPQEDITTRLQKLKSLFENGLIDEAEYKNKKDELLKLL